MVLILRQRIADKLIEIGAVKIDTADPFIWSSGIQSPIYCDNRLTMSYPEIRNMIAQAFIKEMDHEQVDIVAGCATAGIPHAAFISQQLDLPMIYVRSKPKEHGLNNLIEGSFRKGDRVVVIEDLVSTGQSAIQVANALKNEGCHVEKVFSIFTYGLSCAKDNFVDANLTHESLVTFDDIIGQLVERNDIAKSEQDNLLAWRDDLVLS
ncbi:orotate phosphoribosyltransferase [Alkalibacillus aidingensis]|uniref:orotate phosphoribosyltransferase n=1 Tax=Alkalibacillus aidingensis TaxID=2747607 RepID=UPI0016606180|nr:orotate phosphoribosyltransferase [Alkalibacillus aidingensis]